MPYKRIFWVMLVITGLGTLLTQCMQQNKAEEITDVRGMGYAGAATCKSCHAAIYNSYITTAHSRTTSEASRETILGSFHPPTNAYHYKKNGLKVVMQEEGGKFFQVPFLNEKQHDAFPFDIVVGSGRKAQTYLYWFGTNIYQLPVTYSVAAKSWVNSPNYPADKARFDRPILVSCFECHSSFIDRTGYVMQGRQPVDEFDRNKIIYGIDCERCHGPAKDHVIYHEQNPGDKKGKFLTSFKSLTSFQKLEGCATCHSPSIEIKQSSFYYRPGDLKSKFFRYDTSHVPVDQQDVHGNQYQLVMDSKCAKSTQLTCNSCHNPHATERNNLQLLSSRCLNCHQEGKNFCKMAPELGATIVNNCIDCHMPALPSKLITLLSEGTPAATPNMVRSHLISIYPDATKKFLAANKITKAH